MSVLAEKMRKARQSRVEAGGYTFVILRPTPEDIAELAGKITLASLKQFVVGWDGVKELDLIPGGDPHPLAFDADACCEWLADRPDLMGPVGDAILAACTKYSEALRAREKN